MSIEPEICCYFLSYGILVSKGCAFPMILVNMRTKVYDTHDSGGVCPLLGKWRVTFFHLRWHEHYTFLSFIQFHMHYLIVRAVPEIVLQEEWAANICPMVGGILDFHCLKSRGASQSFCQVEWGFMTLWKCAIGSLIATSIWNKMVGSRNYLE